MLSFVFQKMRSKKWLIASLLIGNILLMAVASASSMYSNAVMQRALTQSLSDYMVTNNAYPGTISIQENMTQKFSENQQNLHTSNSLKEKLQKLAQDIGSPVLEVVTQYSLNSQGLLQEWKGPDDAKETANILAFSNLESHIKLVSGTMYSGKLEDNTIEVIAKDKTLYDLYLTVGQTLTLTTQVNGEKVPYKLKVVGTYDVADPNHPYWFKAASRQMSEFLMDPVLFEQLFLGPEEGLGVGCTVEHRALMNYQEFVAADTLATLNLTAQFRRDVEEMGLSSPTIAFEDVMVDFYNESEQMKVTIWALQTPIFVMLAAFVFMVSRQMLELEQNEISVFKSRGAAKHQIILLYLEQSAIVAAIGLLVGIPLGMLVCKMLGSANAFLEFVSRSGMRVVITLESLLYALIAAVFSIGTMVIPVLKFSNVGIVDHKRKKMRKNKNPWWQMVFLDVILLAVSLYFLNQYKGMEEVLTLKVMAGEGLDTMLYLSSALFMMSAGLVMFRVLPWIIRLIFWIGKKFWSPAIYASFMRILRAQDNQGFLVVFLVITVAMGIFNTQTARTINANGEEQIDYSVGADLVVQENWLTVDRQNWKNILAQTKADSTMPAFVEPDYSRYQALPEVENLAKVMIDGRGAVRIGDNYLNENVTIMGIHTKDFGNTAWFKDSLLQTHINEFLNVMSRNTKAVLVSSNFRDQLGFNLGQEIDFKNYWGKRATGIIAGFVDYWPGYSPVTRFMDEDGTLKTESNFLVVSHLDYLQSEWGVQPYEIWMDVKDSTGFFYEFANKNYVNTVYIKDTAQELVDMKNDPMFQGTNGIMTIGFIIVLLLCTVGFLIYWILSIQSRTMQFGIFRAMGMSLGEILSMLLNEQIFISGAAIAGGVLVGKLTSDLFIPLLQIAYTSADRAIPLEIISQASDNVRLALVIGGMMVICMIVLIGLISKIRISQALKLGED